MRGLVLFFLTATAVLAQEGSDGGKPPDTNEPEAAELLKKLEDKVAAGKTAVFKLKMTVKSNQGTGTFDIDAAFKEGGKARVEMNGKFGDRPATVLLVTDGKKVSVSGARGNGMFDATEGLEARIRKSILKFGVMPTMDAAMMPGGDGRLDSFQVADAKIAGEETIGERTVKVLTYVGGTPGTPLRFEHKVWVDEEKLTIVKREMKDPTSGAVTEEWSEMSVDGEVADSKFEIK
ncbi:MAG: hypothetical protein HYY18_13220 [Planctomycetes bacterium]|nr:hypothetical protein [Planctomycetota bacterium]